MITNLLDDKRHHSQMLYKNDSGFILIESSRVFSCQDLLDFAGVSFAFIFCFLLLSQKFNVLDKIAPFSRALI